MRRMFDNQSYQAGFKELDLRKELDLIMFGENGGPRHGHLILIRHFREVDNHRVSCTCLNTLTREASNDCIYCDGEGYLWDSYRDWEDRKSTRLNSSHSGESRMPSSA